MTENPEKQGGGRPRGRPRSFDLDEVTDVALGLFWKQGFEATSVEQVTAITGVRASSLYAAYGNKHGLFRAVVDRYRLRVGAALDELADGSAGLDDVVAFVEWVRAGIASSTALRAAARVAGSGSTTLRYCCGQSVSCSALNTL